MEIIVNNLTTTEKYNLIKLIILMVLTKNNTISINDVPYLIKTNTTKNLTIKKNLST